MCYCCNYFKNNQYPLLHAYGALVLSNLLACFWCKPNIVPPKKSSVKTRCVQTTEMSINVIKRVLLFFFCCCCTVLLSLNASSLTPSLFQPAMQPYFGGSSVFLGVSFLKQTKGVEDWREKWRGEVKILSHHPILTLP